jgi:two-component system cell cycle response regulator
MNTDAYRILVVDCSPGDASPYERLLRPVPGNRCEFRRAASGREGLACLDRQPWDCVLLEDRLPDMDGVEFLTEFHRHPNSIGTPVLLLTAPGGEKAGVAAMRAGAADCLAKEELNSELLSRAVQRAVEKKRSEAALREHSAFLEANIEELKRANRQIIEQQRSVIEEERLKVLLQMAGATVHELNQPLTALLGGIELLQGGGEVSGEDLARLSNAGCRIAEVVKKIQAMEYDPRRPILGAPSASARPGDIAVLSVEDAPEDFERLRRGLAEIGVSRVRHAATAAAAFEEMGRGPLDIVFLDYFLPDATALDIMKKMRLEAVEAAVVILTGQGDEIIASQTIQAGAYDYLPKSQLSAESLAKAIRNTLEKHRLRGEIESMTRRLSEMAIRDDLTGLYNKRYFTEALDREIDRALRYGQKLSLCMADIDHFKAVNDSYGHPAGDGVLRQLGALIQNSTRKSDISCRYGGEEFAIILPDINAVQAAKFAERLRRQIEALPLEPEGRPIRVTISLGIAQYDAESPMDLDAFVRAADDRLYHAKKKGRNCVVSAMTS